MLTAQSNWLRAINYYQASTFALDAADEKRQGRMLADHFNVFQTGSSTGIVTRHNDGVNQPTFC